MFQMPRFVMTGLSIVTISLTVIACADQPTSSSNSRQGNTDASITNDTQRAVDQITTAYLSMRSELASDSIAQVPGHLRTIRGAAQSLQDSSGHDNNAATLTDQSSAITSAADFEVNDLEQTRDKLVALSGAVVNLVQAHAPSDEVTANLYLAQCPMVENGLWLQTTKKVTNPYMGSRMLSCGSIQQAIKGPAVTGQNAGS